MKKDKEIITKFKCPECKNKWTESYKWALSRSLCHQCDREVIKPIRSKKLDIVSIENNKRVRPMTEWEKMKSEFYSSDKKWRDNIASRKTLPDGRIALTNHKGEITGLMPNQGEIKKRK